MRSLIIHDYSYYHKIMNLLHNREQPADRAKSAARLLDVLEVLSRHQAGLTFTQIEKAIKIPKATLHHILHLLVERAYLTRDVERKVFAPGIRLMEMGALCLQGSTMVSAAVPVMEQVHQLTGELVLCGVNDGDEMLIIQQIASTHNITVNVPVGSRWPLYCTAQGQAWLASWADDRVSLLYPNGQLELRTSNTLRSVAELHRRLEQVRREGVAVIRGEVISGEMSIGAAILGPGGRPVGAISTAVPNSRGTEAYLRRLARLIRAAAANISLRLGQVGVSAYTASLERVWAETPELENG